MTFSQKTQALILSFLLAAQITGCAGKQKTINETLLALSPEETGAVLRFETKPAAQKGKAPQRVSQVKLSTEHLKIDSNLVSLFGTTEIQGQESPFYAEMGIARKDNKIVRVPELDHFAILVSEETSIGEMRKILDYQTINGLFVRRTYDAPRVAKSDGKPFFLQFARDLNYYEIFLADSQNKTRTLRCTNTPSGIDGSQKCSDFPASEDPLTARKSCDEFAASIFAPLFNRLQSTLETIQDENGKEKGPLVQPLAENVRKNILKARAAQIPAEALQMKK